MLIMSSVYFAYANLDSLCSLALHRFQSLEYLVLVALLYNYVRCLLLLGLLSCVFVQV